MKKIFFPAILIISASLFLIHGRAFSQVKSVRWYTLQEAERLMRTTPKPLFIDTYTDWCGWCRKMDNETFSDPVISDILNKKFYPVKFNAEGKEKITFMGQTYINDGKYGNAHQLAVALLQGQLSYPTVVFMLQNEKSEYEVAPIPGFKQAKEMEMILTFFADNTYKTRTWEDFQKSFVGKVK